MRKSLVFGFLFPFCAFSAFLPKQPSPLTRGLGVFHRTAVEFLPTIVEEQPHLIQDAALYYTRIEPLLESQRLDFIEKAAEQGLESTMELMLLIHPTVGTTGVEAFQTACENGRTEIIEIFKSGGIVDFDFDALAATECLVNAARHGREGLVRHFMNETRQSDAVLIEASRNAALGGHLSLVKFLLSQVPSQRSILSAYDKVFHAAACSGSYEILNEVLKMSGRDAASFDKPTIRRFGSKPGDLPSLATPYACAGGNGHLKIMKALDKHRGPIGPSENEGNAIFVHAAQNGFISVIHEIEKSTQLNYGYLGHSALKQAVANGHLDVVKHVMAKYSGNEDGLMEGLNDALIAAASKCHTAIFNFLISNFSHFGTDLGFDGNAAFVMAASSGCETIIQIYIDQSIDISTSLEKAIVEAALNGQKSLLRKWLPVIKERFTVRVSTYVKAFEAAAKNGHEEILWMFLDSYSQRSMETAMRNEAFVQAASNGHLNIIEMLTKLPQKYRILPSVPDNRALIMASANGHFDVVNYLLSLPGLNPSAKQATLAFTSAASNGHLRILTLLISKLNSVDPGVSRNDALINAAYKGYKSIVAFLITLKSKYPTIDPAIDDWSVLRVAVTNSRVGVVKLLVNEVGGAIKVPQKLIEDVLENARNPEIVKVLQDAIRM